MALVVRDRVKETSTTTGTGTFTLAGAVTGFESFASVGNSNTTYYCCTDNTDFEIGIGTYTSSGTTLSRDTILQSSNSDNKVDWGAGTRTIFCTYPADKAVFEDASGHVSIPHDLFIAGGLIDLKNDGGAVSQIKFYCESSNAHAQTLIGAPHSESASNTLTLPSSGGNAKLLSATSTATVTNKSIDSDNNTITNIVNADIKSSAAIADTKLDTISTAGKVAISALDIDGGTDIGAALADSDEIIVDDGGGGTNRRADMSRVKTYIADVTLTTAAQTNITSVGTLTNFTTSGDVTMTGTGDGSGAGPLLNIVRDSASPADNDFIGAIVFKGDDSAGNEQTYANIHGRIMDATDGSEDGRIEFRLRKDGSGGLSYAFDPNKLTLADECSIEFFQHGGTSFDVTLAAATPSADRTVTLPDATGTVITTGNTSDVTTVGTLTTLTVDNVIINGSTIGHTGDTDLMTVASGVLTVAGEVDATSLDISGDADIDGTLEADAITVNGTALNTVIADEATALAIALG
jgi:hypothetical protein